MAITYPSMQDDKTTAVLIPCHNEEATIGKVIDDFRTALPQAIIYVFDNCCTDKTAKIAAEKGAIVVKEPRKGKGFVIESMFHKVVADYYIMVDGDDTYPAENAAELLAPVIAGDADMVVGARLTNYTEKSFRPLHVAGNGLVRFLINKIFNTKLSDIMSGYRAFNANVVKRIPVVSAGFEVETEMTIQMLYYKLHVIERQIPYRDRPHGSVSKLRTFHDGFRVLWKIFSLFRAAKPLTFFGIIAVVFFALGLAAGIPPILGYIETHKVEKFPLAILATGLMIISAINLFMGVLLHAINWRFKELHNVIWRGK